MRRGFKSEAEEIAMELRSELGLGCNDPMEILDLAEHLAIPVYTIRQVADQCPRNSFSQFFSTIDPDSFSAVTIFCGYKRFIIHNENHHAHRQASDLAHELSHTILEHPPTPISDRNGERYWNGDVEEEASWLGAALLVPRPGALEMCKARCTIAEIAAHYRVSQSLCGWRIRQTGADKQASRWRDR